MARSLAARLGVAHRYFSTDHDSSSEPLRVIVHRFLVAGEGSIDHLSGYMDGFAIWRELFQAGITGIIRGDEGFGWIEVTSETNVRYSVGALLLEDYFSADLLRRWVCLHNAGQKSFNATPTEAFVGDCQSGGHYTQALCPGPQATEGFTLAAHWG